MRRRRQLRGLGQEALVPRRRRVWPWVVGALVLAGGGFLVWKLTRKRNPRDVFGNVNMIISRAMSNVGYHGGLAYREREGGGYTFDIPWEAYQRLKTGKEWARMVREVCQYTRSVDPESNEFVSIYYFSQTEPGKPAMSESGTLNHGPCL